MKTVKVSRPIAKWARDQTVGSQLGGATATGPGVGDAGLRIAIDWVTSWLGRRRQEVQELPGHRARLNVQSCYCKLKPNALVSEQCSQ